jgi:diacylglycerol O-acyltransferase / wax synthase
MIAIPEPSQKQRPWSRGSRAPELGALAVLDGGLAGPGGRVRVEAVREVIAARLRLVPRFRQLLYVLPPGLGRPLWVDAPAFDLADHVRVVPVPAPGDEAALLRAAEQLRRVRLDRSRPLWQMWLLPGLPEGRVWRRAFSGCQKVESHARRRHRIRACPD